MRMRNGYGLCAALMIGDLLVFWLLKQLGVLRVGHIPPNWVKVTFLVPLYASSLLFLALLLCGAKAGITYDPNGGRKVRFSENPLYFSVVFVMSLVAAILMLYWLTVVLLDNPASTGYVH